MRLIGSQLRCVRGGREVFSDLGFAVPAGEALVVTGPNGAGKSSLLRLVAGLVRPAEGSVVLEGGDPEQSVPEQAHYLGHLDPLKTALTANENLRFWADYLGGSGAWASAETLAEALDSVGLGELADLPAAYLSAGQRRRLAIARLLAARRPVWLLDEPTSTLDAAAQIRFAAIMQDHLAGGGIILAATHVPLGLAGARELQMGDAVSRQEVMQ